MSTTTTQPLTIEQLEAGDDQIIEIVGHNFGLTDFGPTDFALSRRSFVQIVAAGLLIVAAAPAFAQERRGNNFHGRGSARAVPLDARLHIAKDGTITLLTGKVEGGQGARAEITQAAAEELGVPLAQVTLVMADTDLVPDDGITAGSGTTPRTIPNVRAACATARQLLAAFASGDSNRTYADLAAADAASLKQAASGDAQLTPAKDWKILGHPAARPNGREIVTGTHTYPADVIRPGMLYGKILRAPSFGATLTDIDLAKAKAIPGVIVVRDGAFIAVAAPNTHIAKQALAALADSAKWDESNKSSSATLYKDLRDHARGGVPENPFADEFASASKKLAATFNVPYIQHCPMEPRSAVAEWDENGKVTIWTSSQNPFGVRREVAGAFHIPEDKVRIIVPDFGGGFGGKHTGDSAVEAARLAQAAKKPVTVRWTRAEELTWAYFRPAAVIDIQATLSADGKLTSWHMLSINPGRSGVDSPYEISKSNSQAIDSQPPLRHGSYRALASTAHNFAREGMMDELAFAAGKDPLEFRLAHLKDDRLIAVLQIAADKFGWTDRRSKPREKNTGIGLACAAEKGSFVAARAEVEIVPAEINASASDPAPNVVRVKHVCQAFDAGAICNPANLHSQVMGGIIMAVGPLLREAMQFENGKITNASFWQYQVPRMRDIPTIDIHLIDRKDIPSAGAGETPLIVLAPAVRNAVYDATNTWLRDLPLSLPKRA